MLVDYLLNYYLLINSSLFITLIISLSYFFKRNGFILVILLGIIYDLLFSRYLFLYLTSFYLIYNLVIFLKKNKANYLNYLLVLMIGIICFNIIKFLILFTFNLVDLSFINLLKIIIENLISGIVFSLLYFVFKRIDYNKK